MTVTSNTIANRAILQMGGNQPAVTGFAPTFDNSTNGRALQYLYDEVVQAVVRQNAWDFARQNVLLVQTYPPPPPLPWTYEYLYPAAPYYTVNAVQVWQVRPSKTSSQNVMDPLNPLPINWVVGDAVVSGYVDVVGTAIITIPITPQTLKVIWTNQDQAACVCSVVGPESTWDALFQEAVVRLLASCLAMATAGKPDVAELLLQSGSGFEGIGERRNDE